jgi:transcription elongation factor GreA
MKKQFHLTQSGVDQLKKEHTELIAQRVIIAERIKQARELGDLSENAEYQTAREEQDRLEARIGELEHVLQNLQLIKKPRSDGHIRLGSTVKLQATRGKNEQQFQIVGTLEADPLNGKISDESPIGKALMGKKAGDRVEIKNNSHTTAFNVIAVS